jgi:hypothetical protein
MLKYFYDCCPATGSTVSPSPVPAGDTNAPNQENRELFASLAISKAGPQYLDKIGQHPVIFITFKNVKELDWTSCISNIKQIIQDEYLKNDYLLDSPVIKSAEKGYFKKIIDLEGSSVDYAKSLEKLLIFLSRHYGRKVVILIDEYDAPIHAGFTNQYYENVISFMRNFLCGGLKDTGQYLEKGVLTGIMRVARESIFSGLNNPGVFTLLSEEFNDKFGFTEEEVKIMLKDFDVFDRYDEVQQWYNGYNFGSRIIYNPWSITNFLSSTGKELKHYWVNTSDNAIVDSLLSREGKELKKELEQLIRGESIEKAIDENIILKEVTRREDLLWSFLLMGGYLKQTAKRRDPASGKIFYKLSIPNEEVKITYTGIIDRYFSNKIENEQLEIMLKALVEGDIVLFEEILQKVVRGVFSYHDFSDEPEKVYHALVAGMLTWISNTHEIKSNRESGYGRYDIMIIPADVSQWGYVIEFKKTRKNETVKTAEESAFKQIEEKKYEMELVQRGVKNYKKLAVVFKGKDVTVKEG